MNPVALAVVAVVSIFVTSTLSAADSAITVRRRENSTVLAYQRVELQVGIDRQYSNPFDPDEIAVDATITSPDGKTISLPAFWGRDFPDVFDAAAIKKPSPQPSPARLNSPKSGVPGEGEDAPSFRVRFCPTAAGKWTVIVTAKDRDGVRTSSPLTLDVGPSDNRGFIRVARQNHRYLQFDSGAPYFPVGLNICWSDHEDNPQFLGWFKSLSENGGNFARVWMCHPPVMIENEKAGLGKFDLAHASYFDDVLSMAEQRGIYLMLTFNNHRELIDHDMWGPAGWPVNPYNAANGGPATQPVDFFTDETARKLFKRRLRYFIARYSSFTSVACWELFNEQENDRIRDMQPAWNQEMAAYLNANDPYGHLVSTSAMMPKAVWQMPEMSITQEHLYGDEGLVDMATPIVAIVKRQEKFDKPFFLAECGISYKGPDTKFDPNGTGTSLHNSMWATTMSGACGAASYWWWDNYIGPKNLWQSYLGISRFSAAVDWPRRKFQRIELASPQRADSREETFSDLTISCGGGWGKADDEPITVSASGAVSSAAPHFFYGPAKADMRTRTTLIADVKNAGDLTFHVDTVSDQATLRVWIDDKPVADLQYSALPGSPDQESTKLLPGDDGVYQAVINKDRKVPIATGKHKIVLDNIAGDWISLSSITISNAKSSRSADLNALALQDASSGETLIWIYDATSNWQTDQSGNPPRQLEGLQLTVPVSAVGTCDAAWWDTRSGKIVRHDALSSEQGMLDLRTPKFARDIACRIVPAAAK